jgi:hypothetical protein
MTANRSVEGEQGASPLAQPTAGRLRAGRGSQPESTEKPIGRMDGIGR